MYWKKYFTLIFSFLINLNTALSDINVFNKKDFPLIEIFPSNPSKDTLIMIMSGDSGWNSIDQLLSEELSKNSYPVVGLNTLKYFWEKRTPEETSNDMQDILLYYLNSLHLNKLILIGYSYGASFIPFIANRLNTNLQNATKLLVLLSPSEKVEFEFHLKQWVYDTNSGDLVFPEIEKISQKKTLCVFGEREQDTLCSLKPLQKKTNIEIIKLKGGHNYNKDLSLLIERIRQETY